MRDFTKLQQSILNYNLEKQFIDDVLAYLVSAMSLRLAEDEKGYEVVQLCRTTGQKSYLCLLSASVAAPESDSDDSAQLGDDESMLQSIAKPTFLKQPEFRHYLVGIDLPKSRELQATIGQAVTQDGQALNEECSLFLKTLRNIIKDEALPTSSLKSIDLEIDAKAERTYLGINQKVEHHWGDIDAKRQFESELVGSEQYKNMIQAILRAYALVSKENLKTNFDLQEWMQEISKVEWKYVHTSLAVR